MLWPDSDSERMAGYGWYVGPKPCILLVDVASSVAVAAWPNAARPGRSRERFPRARRRQEVLGSRAGWLATVNRPCQFAWVGLASSDPARATAFYTGLFGWRSHELATDMGAVTIFSLRDEDVAILYSQTPEARAADVAPHWTSFIAVPDALAAVTEALDHGGAILREPFDVVDRGRVATVRDPSGAVISLWQPLTQSGATLVSSVNAHARTELVTADLARAKSFYGAVFGWRFEDDAPRSVRVIDVPGPYVTMRAHAEREPLGDGWLPYFMVEDVSETAAGAASLGGAYLGNAPEADSALIADPTGATFAVLAETSA